MSNRAAKAGLAVIAVIVLAGCLPGKGKVIDRGTYYNAGSKTLQPWLQVEAPNGEIGKGDVSWRVYRRCHVGDAWPECKR